MWQSGLERCVLFTDGFKAILTFLSSHLQSTVQNALQIHLCSLSGKGSWFTSCQHLSVDLDKAFTLGHTKEGLVEESTILSAVMETTHPSMLG